MCSYKSYSGPIAVLACLVAWVGPVPAVGAFDVNASTFSVIWNVPAHGCEARTPFHLDRWGIVENGQGDEWMGDNMTLMYSFGDWPTIAADGTRNNGGIPQLGNLSAHLEKAQADIVAAIPDPNFSGVAVIDFESWRPVGGCARVTPALPYLTH